MKHKCDGCRYKGEHQEMTFKPFGVCTRYTNLIEAEKAYNADVCPCENKDGGSSFALSADETLAEAFQNLSRFIEEAIPIIREYAKIAVKICEKCISLYPNKRVVHLALHAKKERTRKKNMHRILKDIQKWRADDEA